MFTFKPENKRLCLVTTLAGALLLGSGTLPAAVSEKEGGPTPQVENQTAPSGPIPPAESAKPSEATPAMPTPANSSPADQALANSLPPGQALWLGDDQNRFLAILTPDQSGHPKGGAIILHDANAHPNWPDVIRPLRTSLPPHGWATIAIQLPPLNSNGEYGAYQPAINTRIQKAAEQLRTQGINHIVLIGHGSGAMGAAAYLASQSEDQGIRAFVGISMSVFKTEKSDDYLPSQLDKIKLPMLDIYGSRDLASVTFSAKTRELAAKHLGNKALTEQKQDASKPADPSKTSNNIAQRDIAYRQMMIEGADHNFTGQGEMLSKRVLGWMELEVKE